MPAGIRITTAEFISRATLQHGEMYSYERTEYVRQKDKVTIICREHGPFLQNPNNHLQGAGCKKCADISSGSTQRLTKEVFVMQARSIHRERFTYDDVAYVSFHSKVSITCKEHGVFSQTPANHINGKGCPACKGIEHGKRNRSTLDEFKSSATARHGGVYDYSNVVYEGSLVKVEINCERHGAFLQLPSDHVMGAGCPTCRVGGYKQQRPGSFYVMSCGDITKVGITNNCPNFRAKSISTSYGRQFTLEQFWTFDDGAVADNLETTILAILKSKYKQPTTKFDGYTECFLDVDRHDLLRRIAELT